MKLASYAEFESKKRAVTLGRLGLIVGAHALLLGGGYFVTQHGSRMEDGQTALAGANGLVTWSNQDANASSPTVKDGSASVFDERASNLSGYNGETLYASASANASDERTGRFAPRRPTETNTNSQSNTAPSASPSSSPSDSVLRPRPLNSGPSGSSQSFQSNSAAGTTFEYKVQPNDSLWAIAQRFKVKTSEIQAVNPGINASFIKVGQVLQIPRESSASEPAPSGDTGGIGIKAAPVDGSVYVVKSGDSLSRIASRQGVTVAELRSANNLPNDMIRIGQELIIPGVSKKPEIATRQHTGQKVVVKPGDTLDRISSVFGVSVRELQDLNNISDPRSIRAGQTLLIPERAKTVAEPQPKPLPRRSTTDTQTPPPAQLQQQKTPPAELETLDTLTPADSNNLPVLDDAFQADDLEEQPLIPIKE